MFKKLILTCFLLFAATNIAQADDGRHRPLTTPNFENVIEFEEEFSWMTINNLIEDIEEEIKKGKKVINIGLNSSGGSIFAGNKLIHKILFYQAKGIKFRGIVREYCMSMCFVTLQTLNERLAYPFAILLDHPSSGGANKAALAQIEELLDLVVEERLKKAGKSESEIKLYKLMVLNEFYFNTKMAISLGLLDKIIIPGMEETPVKKEKPDVKEKK